MYKITQSQLWKLLFRGLLSINIFEDFSIVETRNFSWIRLQHGLFRVYFTTSLEIIFSPGFPFTNTD